MEGHLSFPLQIIVECLDVLKHVAAQIVKNQLQLVGGDWNMTGLFSHSVGNVIIPIDFPIFQMGWNHQPDQVQVELDDSTKEIENI